jgi:hypothetical protein
MRRKLGILAVNMKVHPVYIRCDNTEGEQKLLTSKGN